MKKILMQKPGYKLMYILKCNNCKCKFAFEYSDVEFGSLTDGGVTCPMCHKYNSIFFKDVKKKNVKIESKD